MAVRPAPTELHELVACFDDDLVELALRLRARVLTVVPRAHETVWDATNAVSLVYSPTPRWQDGIVHIATYGTRVNLGFNDGATLPDPRLLLTGTGSRIRHVSFRTATEADAPWIDEYVAAAAAQAGLDAAMGDGGTTIRVSKGPKRRPT